MYAGMLDNCMLYNRTLPFSEIENQYNDTACGIQVKSNSNNSYGGTSLDIPFVSTDANITSLTCQVANVGHINGIDVFDNWNTTTPFTASVVYNPARYITIRGVTQNQASVDFSSSAIDSITTSIDQFGMIAGVIKSINSGFLLISLCILIIGAVAILRYLDYI
jgi:hypothetical protein